MIKGRLMIVDDEEDIREILRDTLLPYASEIVEAKDGLQACQIIEKDLITQSDKTDIIYHLIISDINMPIKSGMAFLKWLRETAQLNTPFIVLTGHGDKSAAMEALKLGAFDFINKPWDEDSLIELAKKAIDLGHFMKLARGDQDLMLVAEKLRAAQTALSEKLLSKEFTQKTNR